MQSWEPRLPPSVGLMPSPSPKQLAPTSLIILARAHTHTHTHIKTPTKWDTDTLDGVDGYHTMIKSAELGKVLLKCILATWASVRWRLPTWIDYSHWPGRELSRRPIDSMKEEQTGQKLTSVLVMREILVIIFFINVSPWVHRRFIHFYKTVYIPWGQIIHLCQNVAIIAAS